VAEGDTVHRVASRLEAALGGRLIDLAEAPARRSPVHRDVGGLHGRELERVEARGKHLLASFSGGLALHSHLGINGRWTIRPGGPPPRGAPWIALGADRTVAAQFGGRLLRLVPEARLRNDLGLAQLGPDPLAPGFDREAATRRLLAAGPDREVGDALLDQRVVAGIGNAIRAEACFRAGVSPWRRLGDLDRDEAAALVGASERVMRVSLERGRRPRSIYRAAGRPCPVCGTAIRSRGQGDANRIAYWCDRCQG
jgi:endonuclease VIII